MKAMNELFAMGFLLWIMGITVSFIGGFIGLEPDGDGERFFITIGAIWIVIWFLIKKPQ